MKVLFIHNEYQFKGGEDTVLELEKDLLEKKGHEVHVLKFSNSTINSFTARVRTGLQSFYNRDAARQLTEAVNSFRPDIIHVHNLFFKASPSILYRAKKLGIPVVMTIHNYRLICANALLLRNNKICELCIQKKFPLSGVRYKCYRSSAIESALVTGITGFHKLLGTWRKNIDSLIVLSTFMKDKLLHSSLQFPAQDIVVKPNFVPDIYDGPSPRDNYFLFVGRLSREKGIDTLLDCFSGSNSARLIIAGDGPEKERVMAAASLDPAISYIGQQPKENIIALMKKSKALIFPSIWYEGMPMTIIESLATGTPVIASGLGAMTEMVRDGYNGFLFPAGNAKELQKRIQFFSTIETDDQYLYKNARQSYLDNYQPEVHYASILKIYENALANRRSSANV